MKNQKEIYEALLAGETLKYYMGDEMVWMNKDGVLQSRSGICLYSFDTPANWSIIDTTVGLMEALAALADGKQVRPVGEAVWWSADKYGCIWKQEETGNRVQITTRLATARFIVRDKP